MINLNRYAHSHDSLEIVQREHVPYVLKTFYSDLDRASRNVQKQRLFRTIYTGCAQINAASVLSFNIFADRAELLMPYIEGMTGHMFPVHATKNIAHTLGASLSTLVYSELNDSHEEMIETILFRNKLISVFDATQDSCLKQLVGKCLAVVDSYPSELLFPMGHCHGDLTLSNVILDPLSGITLIDFLDTFLETPLQDVAKLKQDYIYGWSFRMNPTPLNVKAEILCRHHFPKAICQIERMYPKQVHLLMLTTLARIAPYVKDAVTKQWLVCSMTDCLGVSQK
jgi:hypothetical protein